MSLRLVDRFRTLIRADAHGVIECMEERSLLLKQYVREAEIELNRKRARLEALQDEEKRLEDDLARREEEIRSLDEDIKLAMREEKEELARFAIRRLLPRRRELKVLRTQIRERVDERTSLEQRLETQEAEFEGLKTRVRTELARSAEAAQHPDWLSEPLVADEEIELELIRRRQGLEGGTA